jgi:nicotinamide-nucleotide amidase
MRVEIVSVGDELLSGAIVNGNAAWLGETLTGAGFEVTRGAVVGDTATDIVAVVSAALWHADAVVLTGGLGPTSDDRTREALATCAGVPLVRDEVAERRVRGFYAAPGRPRMRDESLRMADAPQGAALLPNPAGSAPGLLVEIEGRPVYALPGVPAEMRAITAESVLPDLARRAGRPAAIVTRTLRTAVAYESGVAERLRPFEADLPAGLTMAYLAAPGQVRVRLTAHGADRTTALAELETAEAGVRDLLGDAVYGTDDDSLDRVVHRLLAERGATIAAAESLTGGMIGAALTAMPGSSATFRGGVIAYATELKARELGVPEELLAAYGAVHPDVAAAMARGVATRLGADYGVAVTGVAGPEPQDGRPVGTVHVAVSDVSDCGRDAGNTIVHSPLLAGSRADIRELTVVHALDLARRYLLGLGPFTDWEERA